jgi:hypothetical protein
VSAVLEWLDARGEAVPASLAARMREAVLEVEREQAAAAERASSSADGADESLSDPERAAGSLPRLLGEAALACARAALPRCDERQAALHLLAADALLTYALEAAADETAALDELVERFAPARLSALLVADGSGP